MTNVVAYYQTRLHHQLSECLAAGNHFSMPLIGELILYSLYSPAHCSSALSLHYRPQHRTFAIAVVSLVVKTNRCVCHQVHLHLQ